MKARHLLRFGVCLLLVAGMQLPHPATGEDTSSAAWDQERVTELAVELAVTTRGLRREVRRSIPSDRGRTQAHRRHRLLDHLRVLQRETRFLAAELEAGEGFAETLPIAQRIDMLVDRSVVDGRRLFIPKPVQQKIDKANDLLEDLRSFYRNYATPEEASD